MISSDVRRRVRRRGWSGRTRVAACVLAVVAAALLVPSGVWAHAMLVGSDPADGARLDVAPEQITLEFDEPVEVVSDGIRLYDADGQRIGTVAADTLTDLLVAVDVPDLGEGAYVVTWRVVSLDSHPLSGVVTFTVGEAAPVGDDLVAELFGGAGADVAGVLGPLLRALAYAGTLVAAGATFVGWLVLDPTERGRARRVVIRAGAVGVCATVLAVWAQSVAVTGFGPIGALAPAPIAEVLTSGFGQGSMVRLVWLGLLALFGTRGSPMVGQVVAGALAAATFALDGHQRVVEPVALLALFDVVHLWAVAIWVGGLVVVLVTLRTTGEDLRVAHVVARFSGLALWVVAVVVLSGSVMAWVLVRVPAAITTPYGWTLVAKVVLVAVAVATAAHNRWRLVPAVASGGQDVLRRTVGIEAAVLAGVLVVTGFLVAIEPAAQAVGVTGPHVSSATIDEDLTVDLTVEPARVGVNTVHVYVTGPTGRLVGEPGQLTFEFSLEEAGVGPLRVEPFFAGPGHWIANVEELALAGEWQVAVVFAPDRFSESRATFTVPIRR
ncbi:MAG: copper resistance protein CopC [Nitriliruptoraceae bacterium]